MFIYLYNQNDVSDKVYHLSVIPSQKQTGLYSVVCLWGARLDKQLKKKELADGLSKDMAIGLAQSLAKKKIASGYKQTTDLASIPEKVSVEKLLSHKAYKCQDEGVLYLLHANEMPIGVRDDFCSADMGILAHYANGQTQVKNVDLYNTDGAFYLLTSSPEDMKECVKEVKKRFAQFAKEEVFCSEECDLTEIFLIWSIPDTDKYFIICGSGPGEFISSNVIYSENFWTKFKSTNILYALGGSHLALPESFDDGQEREDFFDRLLEVLSESEQEEFFSAMSLCDKEKRRVALIQKEQQQLSATISEVVGNSKSQHKI